MDIGLGGLVLSRMVGQSIEVGHDVKITVVRIGRDAVRLHIAAPQHMNIVRSEIKGRDVPIQESEAGISDLGRRTSEADDNANDAALESRMIDHG